MEAEIIVDVGPNETRVALLEDGELVELHIEKNSSERFVGNIYRGKVKDVLPGMQAAFIDIGYERNAFLYVTDAISQSEYSDNENEKLKGKNLNVCDVLKPGQEITVQVIKEPIGTKGPRVTTHITLPGRYMVLLPNANYTGVSRRIENEDERVRLKKIADSLKPEGKGLIVRTAAEGKETEDFLKDLDYLTKLWETTKKKEYKGHVPRCIYQEYNIVERTVRDLFTQDISKFVINDVQQYERVLELLDLISPSLKARVKYFSKDYQIFEYYQIESQILRAMSRKVWLKSGGYIIIDKTEALTVIDVNTGKFTGRHSLEDTVVKTNIEAAAEIAKQLRLRDIGGIIIIDFIDMHESEHQKMVMDSLIQSLKKDRTKTTVVGMTGLGLIEMTRKKVRSELSTIMSDDCPYCGGTGKAPYKK
ncbi:MAG TPA: Rne/Rng family ribonuclease [Clostridiaceae bacterium]|nr:Rne/Rng family ribonuclease [Clostridiaceae bacterium]